MDQTKEKALLGLYKGGDKGQRRACFSACCKFRPRPLVMCMNVRPIICQDVSISHKSGGQEEKDLLD